MTDSGDDNVTEFTVSELSGALKRTVEQRFGYVRLRAELSGVKTPASGHVYMALKDDKAVLDGVMWRGTASKLSFRPEDGLEVICTGKLTTYAARSKYQMVVERMEPAGEGALMALLEKRKQMLAEEGLFEQSRKKLIPTLPTVIGIVTSPTGAVIRDILHRLADRFPRQVLVWPVLVQGEGAKDQVASAIRGFNALSPESAIPRPDVIIVARGGGSIEDLWAFNEECVVRAAADSDIPLISAVGHETDHSLLDLVADLRAPTPTAAAEMAVPVKADLLYNLADIDRRIAVARSRMIDHRRDQVKSLARALPSPRDLLGMASQRHDDVSARLPVALRSVCTVKEAALSRLSGKLSLGPIKQRLTYDAAAFERLDRRSLQAAMRVLVDKTARLQATSRILESLSFERILDRGFVLVGDQGGKPVTSSQSVRRGDHLTLTFKDGKQQVVVGEEGVTEQLAPATHKKQRPLKKQRPVTPKKNTNDGSQGSLF